MTLTVQLEAGVVACSGFAHWLLEITKSPLLATILEIFNAAVPVFVTVRVCGALVTPTACWLLNARLVADRLTIGAEPAVPVRLITCDSCVPPASVSVMVMVAERVGGVIEVGAKVTLSVHVPIAGTEITHVFV